MDKIQILQLGNEDWSRIYELPEGAEFQYVPVFHDRQRKLYDIVFLDRELLDAEVEPLHKSIKAYTLFVTDRVKLRGAGAWLCKNRRARVISSKDIQRFLLQETGYFFPKPYGEKFQPKNLAISQDFSGSVKWNGNYSVELTGEFGEKFQQIAFWRNNIPVFRGQVIDFWLEYHKDPTVSVSFAVTQFDEGCTANVLKRWEFSETELDQVVQISSEKCNSTIFVSLYAKGKGKFQIVALHDRYSRGAYGSFLPGGERYTAKNREEMFSYFDPGDEKAPLLVFFSGYKTAQGFEGYNLMRSTGCPFLLLAESRLEGGSFYMGNAEYEALYQDIIKKYMEELGFTSDQVILSGISMGSYGALYYGCDIKPHAMILGKPLIHIGNVALNEKYLRPGGFSTSLDILRYLSGGMDTNAAERLNRKFWDKFDTVDWGNSKFVLSYMIEDDYDAEAYDTLLSHLWSEGVSVYGKGIHGRHNDNTEEIVSWFMGQLEKMLKEDFNRKTGRK